MVAALPFASPGMWVSALDLAGDEAAARTRYAHLFQRAVENLCAAYRDDAVNLLVAHTHLEGAAFGDSERRVHLSQDWAATPQTLPPTATYIALGHIHKPQKVAGTLPARYAGSPLQLDFGEVGQEKTFTVVEAAPRRPARIEHVPYEGGRTLRDIEGTMADLAAVGTDIVTIGQCLRPTTHHLPVARWVPPDTFERFRKIGRSLGIAHVEASPLTRSSHHAQEAHAQALASPAGTARVG